MVWVFTLMVMLADPSKLPLTVHFLDREECEAALTRVTQTLPETTDAVCVRSVLPRTPTAMVAP
jgi:hypothetical protein